MCFCASLDINIGDHNWTFNLPENKLVINNEIEKYEFALKESGTYEISLSENSIIVKKPLMLFHLKRINYI